MQSTTLSDYKGEGVQRWRVAETDFVMEPVVNQKEDALHQGVGRHMFIMLVSWWESSSKSPAPCPYWVLLVQVLQAGNTGGLKYGGFPLGGDSHCLG